MNKRIICLLLCLAMFLGLAPSFALAENEYGTVAGVAVTDENCDNIRGQGITGSVSYNPPLGILTLTNASITDADNGCGIDITGITQIVLVGETPSPCPAATLWA